MQAFIDLVGTQVNAPARAEFKLGFFPPDHHVPPAVPTQSPAPQTPGK